MQDPYKKEDFKSNMTNITMDHDIVEKVEVTKSRKKKTLPNFTNFNSVRPFLLLCYRITAK